MPWATTVQCTKTSGDPHLIHAGTGFLGEACNQLITICNRARLLADTLSGRSITLS